MHGDNITSDATGVSDARGMDLPRRRFVERAGYVAPVIVTLLAAPAYAKAGSMKAPPKKPPQQKK